MSAVWRDVSACRRVGVGGMLLESDLLVLTTEN